MVRFSIDSGYLLAYVEELRNRWKSSLREKKKKHAPHDSISLPPRTPKSKEREKNTTIQPLKVRSDTSFHAMLPHGEIRKFVSGDLYYSQREENRITEEDRDRNKISTWRH